MKFKITGIRWSMQKQLLCYMLALAGLLSFALLSGILMLGRFESAEKTIAKTLEFQMAVFERDMAAYFEALAANSIDLSRYVSDLIEQDSRIAGEAFGTLTDDPEAIYQLQSDLLLPLTQKLENLNCSGLFVLLDATVNSRVENAALSRTGLYLQHNRHHSEGSMVLLRGNTAVGKAHSIMPHRKWRLEFRIDLFPSYDAVVARSELPLNEAYFLTQCTTLSGTSEDVVLMAVPVVGSDGTFYGVCGYEVSASYFAAYHAQPAAEERLACMLLTENSDRTYAPLGLSCSGQNNHVQPPDGPIQIHSMGGGLMEISDGQQEFVGVLQPLSITPDAPQTTLAVMIPRADYGSAVIEGTVQVLILVVLLLSFAMSCCILFSKHYLSPILKAMEQIKSKTWGSAPSAIPEIHDLFVYLANQDEEHSSALSSMRSELAEATQIYQDAQKRYAAAQTELEQAQMELHRLSYARKKEVDPDKFQVFLDGLETLTTTEKMILDYYLEGKTVREIMALAQIKETTIRYHNRNIYSKLNVNSLKQLLLYAAMMRQ